MPSIRIPTAGNASALIGKIYRGRDSHHADVIERAYLATSPRTSVQVYTRPTLPTIDLRSIRQFGAYTLQNTDFVVSYTASAAVSIRWDLLTANGRIVLTSTGSARSTPGNIFSPSAGFNYTMIPGRTIVTGSATNSEGRTTDQIFYDIEAVPNLAGGTFTTHGPVQLPAVGLLHRFDINWSGVSFGWPRAVGTITKISGPGTLNASHFDGESGNVHLTLGGELPGMTTVVRFTLTNAHAAPPVYRQRDAVGTVTRDVNVVWPSQ